MNTLEIETQLEALIPGRGLRSLALRWNLAEALSLAFDDFDSMAAWLSSPCPELGAVSPLYMLNTEEGLGEVVGLLRGTWR